MPDAHQASLGWSPLPPAGPVDRAPRPSPTAAAIALLTLAVLAGLIVWVSAQPGWTRAAGLVGLGWLGWWWSRPAHRAVSATLGEGVAAGALVLAIWGVGTPPLALGVVYAGCCIAGLGGGWAIPVLRLAGSTAAYLLAVAVLHQAGAPGITAGAVAAVIPGLPLATLLAVLPPRAVASRRRAERVAEIRRRAAAAVGPTPTLEGAVAALRHAVAAMAAEAEGSQVIVAGDPNGLAGRLGRADGAAGGPPWVEMDPADPDPVAERLRRGGTLGCDEGGWSACAARLRLSPAARRLVLLPLPDAGGEEGSWATLAVATRAPLPPQVAAAWRGLAADLGEALARVRVYRALAGAEARFRAFVETASDLVVATDAGGRVLYASPSVPQFLGRSLNAAGPLDWQPLAHPDDVAALCASIAAALRAPGPGLPVDCRLLGRDGAWHSFDIVPTNLLDHPGAGAMVLTLRDISDRVALETELRHQALHDPLTGLANRALLRDRLEHALAARDRGRRQLVLLLLDLDHFKDVNDTYGHEVGDQVLLELTRRVRRCLRSSDTCARLGGDEFAILVEEATGPETGSVLAARILATLRRPFRITETVRLTVAASVGIAVAADGPVDARALLQECDIALYTAKAEGRGRSVVYGAALEAELGTGPQSRASVLEATLAHARG